MKIHDLTHLITPDIMVWPGTPGPIIAEGSNLERDGFRETRLDFFSHVGTHMDAPAHMLEGAPSLDELPVNTFWGSAWVLDASKAGPGAAIGPEALEGFPGADFLLVSTGWESHWNTPEYFGAYPALAPETVRRALELGVRGIGVDTMGIDPMDDAEYTNHFIMFRAGRVIVENLCGLAPIRGQVVSFAALPLKYENADGAPVRAVAWKD